MVIMLVSRVIYKTNPCVHLQPFCISPSKTWQPYTHTYSGKRAISIVACGQESLHTES